MLACFMSVCFLGIVDAEVVSAAGKCTYVEFNVVPETIVYGFIVSPPADYLANCGPTRLAINYEFRDSFFTFRPTDAERKHCQSMLAWRLTSNISNRAIVTRKCDGMTPMWLGRPGTSLWFGQVAAFIVEPEIWHFDPDRLENLTGCFWPTTGREALQNGKTIIEEPRRTLGEYFLSPDPHDRWQRSRHNPQFEY